MDQTKDRRVRRTKTLLVHSLATLMSQKTIKDITVKELCEHADINRGTFYLHYKDIYHMLESVEQELIDQFEELFHLYSPENCANFPYPLFYDLFTIIDKNSEFCRSLLGPNGDISFLMKMRELFRHQYIQSWVLEHANSPIPQYEYFSNFIIYGCAGLIENWLLCNKPEPPEKMARLVTKLISTGMHSLL